MSEEDRTISNVIDSFSEEEQALVTEDGGLDKLYRNLSKGLGIAGSAFICVFALARQRPTASLIAIAIFVDAAVLMRLMWLGLKLYTFARDHEKILYFSNTIRFERAHDNAPWSAHFGNRGCCRSTEQCQRKVAEDDVFQRLRKLRGKESSTRICNGLLKWLEQSKYDGR